MRSLILFSIAFICTLSMHAQTPVQEPLLPWLANTTPLPKSVAEVKSKCYNSVEGSYDVGKSAGSLPKKIGTTLQKINTADSASAYTMADTAGMGAIQKMTPEQQQAWAMQYAMQQQQAAASASTKLPTAAETSFYDEYTKLAGSVPAFVDSMTKQFSRLVDEHDAKQKRFAQQREEMIKLCPIINAGGGEGGPDPSCVKKAEANYQEWQASWAAEWFAKVAAFISAKKTEINLRFSKGENMLVNNNYFLHPTNEQYKKHAAGFQIQELNCLAGLEGFIEKTWKVGTEIDQNIRISHERCSEKY